MLFRHLQRRLFPWLSLALILVLRLRSLAASAQDAEKDFRLVWFSALVVGRPLVSCRPLLHSRRPPLFLETLLLQSWLDLGLQEKTRQMRGLSKRAQIRKWRNAPLASATKTGGS